MTETANDSDDSVSSAFSGRVPRRLKLFYSVGAAAEAIIGVAFNTFNFFFYTNVLGIPGTLAGLAITIALVFDAVTDPLVGAPLALTPRQAASVHVQRAHTGHGVSVSDLLAAGRVE